MNKNPLSNCCKAPMEVVSANEGTSFYKCTKCGKDCDADQGRNLAGSLFAFCVGLEEKNGNLPFKTTCCVCQKDVFYNNNEETTHVVHVDCMAQMDNGRACKGHVVATSKKNPPTIVAEITKNWIRGQSESPLLAVQFERVIEVNRLRGYKLGSFQIHQSFPYPHAMIETIIATFEAEARMKYFRWAVRVPFLILMFFFLPVLGVMWCFAKDTGEELFMDYLRAWKP